MKLCVSAWRFLLWHSYRNRKMALRIVLLFSEKLIWFNFGFEFLSSWYCSPRQQSMYSIIEWTNESNTLLYVWEGIILSAFHNIGERLEKSSITRQLELNTLIFFCNGMQFYLIISCSWVVNRRKRWLCWNRKKTEELGCEKTTTKMRIGRQKYCDFDMHDVYVLVLVVQPMTGSYLPSGEAHRRSLFYCHFSTPSNERRSAAYL